VFVAFIAVLAGLQTRMIFPGSETQGKPESEVPPRPDAEKVVLATPAGDRVVALFGPALTATGKPHPDAANRPTLLYFYGNGMCMKDAVTDDNADFGWFRRLGVNVMVPDYLGYGMSGGSASEKGCYQTADACYAHLLTRKDIDPRKIVIVGRSLGGGVAIDLASRKNAAGLATFCTFTSMTAMTHKQFPMAPTILLRHKFDSLSKIGKVKCPILLGHGSADGLVPCAMSQALSEAAKAPVRFFKVQGADHNDLFSRGERQIRGEMVSFLESLQPR
jgi:fermentation-respiration switch protein FrsA (DUF1100 family)